MDDPSWVRNCDLLAKSLRSLEKKTATIQRSTNKIVSLKDINRERERVTQTTSTANAADVQDIEGQLRLVERFIKINPQLNSEGAKLMNDAQVCVQSYQAACGGFYNKCIAVESASRKQQNSRSSRAFRDDDESEDGTANEAGALLSKQQANKSGFEDELYDEIMAERARETQEISDNVRDIYDIFHHINELVGEQGVQLDMVDENLSAAERATANATRHLRRAQEYEQSSCRNKALLVLVIVMVFLVSLALIF